MHRLGLHSAKQTYRLFKGLLFSFRVGLWEGSLVSLFQVLVVPRVGSAKVGLSLRWQGWQLAAWILGFVADQRISFYRDCNGDPKNGAPRIDCDSKKNLGTYRCFSKAY